MTHAAYIAAIRKTRDHRPRRSQQSRSTRPRAEVRAYHRTHTGGIPNERRTYIIERRSGQVILVGEAVYREYARRRCSTPRSARDLAGELVTVSVVSIYAARRWPNALPGGTSLERAKRRILRPYWYGEQDYAATRKRLDALGGALDKRA